MRITKAYISGLSVVIGNQEQYERLFGFKVTDMHLSLLEGNWLRISVDWRGNDDISFLKYPELVSYGLSGYYVESQFTFPAADKYKKRKLDRLSIFLNSKLEIRHVYKFHNNTKYGVAIYYAPHGWGEAKEILATYDEDEGPKFDVPQLESDIDPNSTKEDGDRAFKEHVDKMRVFQSLT